MTAHHADLGGLPLAALDARREALASLETTPEQIADIRWRALVYHLDGCDDCQDDLCGHGRRLAWLADQAPGAASFRAGLAVGRTP